MRHPFILSIVVCSLLLSACAREPVANPDPNHTHADFAVWVNGEKLDFSDVSFMSAEYHKGENEEPSANPLRKYLHLHDGVGHVIHRHKPGLTLGDFLRSLGVKDTQQGLDLCLAFPQLPEVTCDDEAGHRTWIMVLSGAQTNLDFEYVFGDEDRILILFPSSGDDAAQQQEIARAWEAMTSDACLYSRTCPWRGEPPIENCIADPEVPCVAY